jgi:hypothetical protein
MSCNGIATAVPWHEISSNIGLEHVSSLVFLTKFQIDRDSKAMGEDGFTFVEQG